MTIENVKRIAKLSKKSKKELRQLNRELERAYTGKELSKWQLIFQIVFLKDAPDK